jgi:hypothetical protein
MGTNFFPVFPAVPVGAPMGPRPAIDLFALVPPSGLDSRLTFICKGDFIEGAIAVECSPDNVIWDVLCQFDAGQDADALSGPRVELSPVVVGADIRFLRLNVQRGTKVRGATIVTAGGEQNCECDSNPVALSCCPCATPLGGGGLDPQSFCTEFPGGAIGPFAITAQDPGFTLGTTGDDTILSFDGTQAGGALFLEAPGPLVLPSQPGSFCFCATMAQNAPLIGVGIGGAYVGLTSGPFNESLLIVTVNPLTGASLATYHIQVFEGAGPTQFLLDTGIPIDGTLHKFVVCRGLLPTDFILTIDNGLSIPFDPGFLPGPMVPFIGTNALGGGVGNPFDLRVDSFCTNSNIIN